MSERYPYSVIIKEVVVKYDIQEKVCDLLEARDNGGVSSFDEEIVNSVGGMNV